MQFNVEPINLIEALRHYAFTQHKFHSTGGRHVCVETIAGNNPLSLTELIEHIDDNDLWTQCDDVFSHQSSIGDSRKAVVDRHRYTQIITRLEEARALVK